MVGYLMKKYVADYPELIAQWHPTKNGNLDPTNITYGSGLRVWWKCNKADDHEWESTVEKRTRKKNPTGCPCCSGQKVVLSNCLDTTHPEIVKQWHPTKNGSLTPCDVTAGSHKKVWWICDKGHEWQAAINNRTNKINPTGCPCCSGQKVVLSNCLATTRPEIAKEWHPTKNGSLTPYNVTAGSGKEVWWKCYNTEFDDHEWKASITKRTSGKNCPCCSGQKVILSNCLATTHPEIAKEWHPTKNGILTAKDITAGSGLKFWWKCEKEHEWKSIVGNRTGKNKCGCPNCNESKGEKRIAIYLSKLQLSYKSQQTFEMCKNKRLLPFDFIVKIEERKGFLIEYNGLQHYEASNFGSDKIDSQQNLLEIQKRDKIKKEFCDKNNIPLLIIPYWDFNKIEERIDEFI